MTKRLIVDGYAVAGLILITLAFAEGHGWIHGAVEIVLVGAVGIVGITAFAIQRAVRRLWRRPPVA